MFKLKYICANIDCAVYTVEFDLSGPPINFNNDDYNKCPHCKEQMARM